MKIALIYEKFISRGGLENYLYSFSKQLVKEGNELELITGATDELTEKLENTTVHRISRQSLRTFSSEAEETLRHLGDIDVSIGFGRTVAHDLHRAGGGCHRFYSDRILHPLKRISSKNRTELALEQQLYTSGKTRHFVVNSQMVSEQLQEAYGLSEPQISVIHTAVDSQKFRPAEDPETRTALRGDLPDEALVFLFVSMNHRRKGLDALLKAWRDAPPEAHLWIVGPELSGRYRKAIQSSGNGERVRVFNSPPNLPEIYRAADIFVHPSLYDACANTVLQAMASGLPGIISQSDGAQQFVRDGENGLLLPDPSDPDQIAAKMHQLHSTGNDFRKSMGTNAREMVFPLDWEAHTRRWQEVIADQIS